MKLFDSLTSKTEKCLVLDIDETLVHTMDTPKGYAKMKIFTDEKFFPYRGRVYKFVLEDFENVGSGKSLEFWGIMRQHLREFLLYCFSYFKYVIIWSAGKRTYVEQIVDIIFNGLQRPHKILAYEDCIIIDDKLTKPLFKLTELIGNDLNLTNTWIIDDKVENFIDNKENGIEIPAYTPDETYSSLIVEDNALILLMNWFDKKNVINSTDVRSLNTKDIFE